MFFAKWERVNKISDAISSYSWLPARDDDRDEMRDGYLAERNLMRIWIKREQISTGKVLWMSLRKKLIKEDSGVAIRER